MKKEIDELDPGWNWIGLAGKFKKSIEREYFRSRSCLRQYNCCNEKKVTLAEMKVFQKLIRDAYDFILRSFMTDDDCLLFEYRVNRGPAFLVLENRTDIRLSCSVCDGCSVPCDLFCENREDPHVQLEFAQAYSRVISRRLSGGLRERFSKRTVGMIIDLCVALRLFADNIMEGAREMR